jgi:sulfoxide reductase heme-binding subunit YedZ
MLGLGLTFSVRRRLGSQRWRRAHRAIPAFWALAVGHAVLNGTDTGAWWFLAAVGLLVLAAGTLLAQRHAGAPERPRAPAPDRG